MGNAGLSSAYIVLNEGGKDGSHAAATPSGAQYNSEHMPSCKKTSEVDYQDVSGYILRLLGKKMFAGFTYCKYI